MVTGLGGKLGIGGGGGGGDIWNCTCNSPSWPDHKHMKTMTNHTWMAYLHDCIIMAWFREYLHLVRRRVNQQRWKQLTPHAVGPELKDWQYIRCSCHLDVWSVGTEERLSRLQTDGFLCYGCLSMELWGSCRTQAVIHSLNIRPTSCDRLCTCDCFRGIGCH